MGRRRQRILLLPRGIDKILYRRRTNTVDIKNSHNLLSDLLIVARGVLMGAADVIPGVSGGTVALIVGIYERLIQAISHFDATFLAHVRRRRWRAAAEHIDLRFLICLGVGVVMGVVALGSLVNKLLHPGSDSQSLARPLTLASFFGMIAASSVLIARLIRIQHSRELVGYVLLGAIGAACAYFLTAIPTAPVDPSYPYVFVCAMIAICAMILPGISGALILLILGVYVHLTDYLHEIRAGHISSEAILTVIVFGSGCAIGLLSFSKLLRWLLTRHKNPTLALLCGLMVGALNKIWPFQHDLTPAIEKLKYKQFENYFPDTLDHQVILCLVVGIIACVVVFALERVTRIGGTEDQKG